VISATGRLLLLGAIAALIAGAAVLVGTSAATGDAIAAVLFGVAGVLLVSLVFLAVGESEDREREREARDQLPEPAARAAPRDRLARSRRPPRRR
jgi:hypothetical protein